METKVIVTTPEELHSLINEAVLKALMDQLPKAIEEANRKPYLTQEDMVELSGWSRRTLQYLRDTEQIDFIQHGRKILYPRDAVDAFLKQCRIKARKW